MDRKRKSPCTAGTVTGENKNLQSKYIADFPESQAEIIFRRDFRMLCIGATVVLICYTIMRLGGWIV